MLFVNRSELILVFATVVATLGTARLGWWQLDRAAQKNVMQTLLDERRALPPLPMTALANDETSALQQHHRQLRLRGEWLGQHTVFLDNRQMEGRPGFFVVTPLRLEDGSAVLVQRGWIPRNSQDRSVVKAPELPTDPVQLLTRVAPSPGRLFEFDHAASGAIRQNLLVPEFARETGLQLRPMSLVQLDEAGSPKDGLLRNWPRPAADVHKNYGYAFQWFALSALIAGLFVWFKLIRNHVKAPNITRTST